MYDIPEATSEMICAQIISPDDIGSLEFILQIVLSDDTPTNGDVASKSVALDCLNLENAVILYIQ